MAAPYIIFYSAIVILLSLLADNQRDFFGNHSGNLLLIAELISVAALFFSTSLWKKGKKSASALLASTSAAALLSFTAWFIHPDQIFYRAGERLKDWEEATNQYLHEPSHERYGNDSEIIIQRLATELTARRYEYRAAQIRYEGDPDFFRSSFFTWLFSLIALALAFTGASKFKAAMSEFKSP
jgi:hypothetical protein